MSVITAARQCFLDMGWPKCACGLEPKIDSVTLRRLPNVLDAVHMACRCGSAMTVMVDLPAEVRKPWIRGSWIPANGPQSERRG